MSYTILGRKILNEHLALATFGLTGLATYLSLPSGDKKAAPAPVVQASSDDESKFIADFIANLEKEDKAGAKH
ncbi:hypothetical protein T439DRAFT_325378 [Meredithblackwellia eburnea MCA 4105]